MEPPSHVPCALYVPQRATTQRNATLYCTAMRSNRDTRTVRYPQGSKSQSPTSFALLLTAAAATALPPRLRLQSPMVFSHGCRCGEHPLPAEYEYEYEYEYSKHQ
mmetsp:Transcript_3367/g.7349  ORF Transcript_3367/g.7349 Transcript_3367/m.7349 type:complete len:105 (-) Transcript_3367:155-469(-)